MNSYNLSRIEKMEDLTENQINSWKKHLFDLKDPRTIFQQPEYYFKSVELKSNITSLISYIVEKNNEIVGVFTFKLRTINRVVNFGHIKLLKSDFNELWCFGSGCLTHCNKEEEAKIKNDILSSLKNDMKKNDAHLYFGEMDENDLFYTNSTDSSVVHFDLDELETFIAKLEDSYDKFLAEKPKKKRHSLKKDISKFERDYEDRYLIRKNGDNLSCDEFMEASKEVLERSWKKGVIGSIVAEENFSTELAFLESLGSAKFYVLEIDEKPVAFAIGYLAGNQFYYEEIAYDESFSRSGAGSYLTLNIVKIMSDENNTGHDRFFSFGVGDNLYKRKICNKRLNSMNKMICLPGTKMIRFIKAKKALGSVYGLIRNVGLKLGVHEKLRQRFKKRKIK